MNDKLLNDSEFQLIPIPEKLNFTKEELWRILDEEIFTGEKLIELLDKQYPEIFSMNVGVFERYTLKQHTLMVIKQFEKYFADQELPANVDKKIFRLFLGLHDIGKPQAVVEGNKNNQHQYTCQYVEKLFITLKIDEKYRKLALVLASGDPMGKYLRGMMDKFAVKEEIEKMAKQAELSIADFWQILCLYFKVDAGSYTQNAGGIKSLDFLFEFDEVNHHLNFAPEIQETIDDLAIGQV